jgi:hypothetical protein
MMTDRAPRETARRSPGLVSPSTHHRVGEKRTREEAVGAPARCMHAVPAAACPTMRSLSVWQVFSIQALQGLLRQGLPRS